MITGMKRCIVYGILTFFGNVSFSVSPNLFDRHDQSVFYAQRDEWDKAHEVMQSLVTSRYDSGEVLYDAGVTSFKKKEYTAAAAYFEHAAHGNDIPGDLKERALFNAGNAHYMLHNLTQATEYYQKVIAHNSGNMRARHNLARLQEMMKDQDQEEKKKNAATSESPKEHEKQDNQAPGGDDKQRDGARQKDNEQRSQEKQEGNGEQQSNEQSNKKQETDQGKNSFDHEKAPDTGQEERVQQQSTQHFQQNQQAEPEKQLDKDKDNSCSGQKKHGTANTKKERLEQKNAQEQWLEHILSARDNADAQASRYYARAQVSRQGAIKHGQKCW